MTAKKESPPIKVVVCEECGAEMSGPDPDDLKATVARHKASH